MSAQATSTTTCSEISGEDFTAKDFRTWAGTVLACTALRELSRRDAGRTPTKHVVQAIEAVAGVLGNTRAVCRKSYIHPAVIDAYVDGTLVNALSRGAVRRTRQPAELSADEAAVLAMLLQSGSGARRKAA